MSDTTIIRLYCKDCDLEKFYEEDLYDSWGTPAFIHYANTGHDVRTEETEPEDVPISATRHTGDPSESS